MAGDWLKIEKATPEKPELDEMSHILGISHKEVFYGVFMVWSYFDSHTEEGHVPSVTKRRLDREAECDGFINAMLQVGWMQEKKGSLIVTDFDKHNGKSAKRRANDALRAANYKARKKSVTEESQKSNGESVTEGELETDQSRDLEKRREEKNNTSTNVDVEASAKKPTKRFKKPTVEEIKSYMIDYGNQKGIFLDLFSEPQKLFDYYESKGWKVGNTAMKDWKAAVRNWMGRIKERGGNNATYQPADNSALGRVKALNAQREAERQAQAEWQDHGQPLGENDGVVWTQVD